MLGKAFVTIWSVLAPSPAGVSETQGLGMTLSVGLTAMVTQGDAALALGSGL